MIGVREDILITGPPRSGTTLTCHLLNKVPDTVALHEPMKVKRFAELASRDEICESIRRFCEEQRGSIQERKRAISKNVEGVVPDNPAAAGREEGRLRQSIASKGEIVIDKPLSPDFALVLKHNAAFAALLGDLVERFPVYAVVRNPLSTISSWNTVAYNAQTGHVPAGERLDPELKAKLASLDDPLDRQLHVLGWFHGQFHRHLPDERILRYESIVESGGRALDVVRPGAAQLNEPLESRNQSSLYDRESMLRVGERLLDSDGAYWETYPRDSVERLLQTSGTRTG